MRHPFRLPAVIGVVAALMLASTPALADGTSKASQFTGTASTSGKMRTIIDITQPNGPNTRHGPFRVQANATIDVNVIGGITPADSLGIYLRNAINADVTLQSFGITSAFTTPSGTAKPSRPKVTRQVGTFNISHSFINGAGGQSAAPSAFTVEDAPGLPPFGLGALALLFAGLGWRERRRRREP